MCVRAHANEYQMCPLCIIVSVLFPFSLLSLHVFVLSLFPYSCSSAIQAFYALILVYCWSLIFSKYTHFGCGIIVKAYVFASVFAGRNVRAKNACFYFVVTTPRACISPSVQVYWISFGTGCYESVYHGSIWSCPWNNRTDMYIRTHVHAYASKLQDSSHPLVHFVSVSLTVMVTSSHDNSWQKLNIRQSHKPSQLTWRNHRLFHLDLTYMLLCRECFHGAHIALCTYRRISRSARYHALWGDATSMEVSTYMPKYLYHS